MIASDIIAAANGKTEVIPYSDDELLDFLNDIRFKIAYEIDLPELVASDTVTTVSTDNSVSLPTNYHKGLFFVSSYAQSKQIGKSAQSYANIAPMLEKYPTLDTVGAITHVVAESGNLIYQGQADDTLLLRYYKEPETLTLDDSPVEIPSHLHRRVLVNYLISEIFDLVEDELEGPKANYEAYYNKFLRGMAELQAYADKLKPRQPRYMRFKDGL